MRVLRKFDLNFDLSFDYVKKNLIHANALSVQLLKLLNFKKGKFYTFVSAEFDESRIHQFLYSLSGCVINERETAEFLFSYLKNNKNLSCVFEDIISKSNDPHLETFYKCGLSYDNEIYYLIDKNNIEKGLISECISDCSAIWHSLFLLTDVILSKKSKTLDLKSIKAICSHVKMIFIGAYDDEGYIFWEKP